MIIQHGQYVYEKQIYNGWYFTVIPSNEIIPMIDGDFSTMSIVSYNDCCDCKPGLNPYPPYPPCPPCPPCPPATPIRPIEKYMSGLNYIKGQLVYLVIGELFHVYNDYRACNVEQSAALNLQHDIDNGYLIPTSAGQFNPSLYYTKTDINQMFSNLLYATEEDIDNMFD